MSEEPETKKQKKGEEGPIPLRTQHAIEMENLRQERGRQLLDLKRRQKEEVERN